MFCLVSSSRRLKKPELSSSALVLDIGFGPRHQDTERCSADAGAEENEEKEKRCVYIKTVVALKGTALTGQNWSYPQDFFMVDGPIVDEYESSVSAG